MAADFTANNMKDDAVNSVTSPAGTTGIVERSIRMLGNAGATTTGNGSWIRTNSYWKTFYLYAVDQLNDAISTEVVVIEGAMELDGTDADANTDAEALVTLNNSTRSFSTEVPWRYIRARVSTHATGVAIQVGLNAQGG